MNVKYNFKHLLMKVLNPYFKSAPKQPINIQIFIFNMKLKSKEFETLGK